MVVVSKNPGDEKKFERKGDLKQNEQKIRTKAAKKVYTQKKKKILLYGTKQQGVEVRGYKTISLCLQNLLAAFLS